MNCGKNLLNALCLVKGRMRFFVADRKKNRYSKILSLFWLSVWLLTMVCPLPASAELVDGTLPHSITEVDFLNGDEGILPAKFIGSATYKVAIDMPQGRNGMTPELTLKYNSIFRDSWVGFGWQLEFGSIERNRKFGVDHGADDFVYRTSNGAYELVAVSSNEFRLEIEGQFLRFVRNTAADGRPSWVMTTKQGVKYYFGTSTDTRQDNVADAGQIFKWCLEKVQDPNGNYLTASYDKDLDNNQIYLQQINYTGHASKTPVHTVLFSYEDRTDAPVGYAPGFKESLTQRLSAIAVKSAGNLTKKYQLNYAPSSSSSRSLLASINIIGRDGTSVLRTLTFDYNQSSVSLPSDHKWEKMKGSGVRIPADINGDGRTDFFSGVADDRAYLYLSKGTDFTRKSCGKLLDLDDQYKVESIFAADVDGDGGKEIIVGPTLEYPKKTVEESISDTGTRQVSVPDFDADPIGGGQFYVFDYENNSFVHRGVWNPATSAVWDGYEKSVHFADVNGDRREDVVIGPDVNGQWRLLLSTGEGFDDQGIVLQSSLTQFYGKNELIHVMDANGHHGDEIVAGPDSSGSYYVLEYNGSSFTYSQWYTGKIGRSAKAEAVRNMDLNGDKIDDFLIAGDKNGDWFALLSTGHSFVLDGKWAEDKYDWVYDNDASIIHTLDMNGDGLLDVLIGPRRGKWYLLQNDGTSLVNKGKVYEDFKSAVPFDGNGDGRQGLLFISDDALTVAEPSSVKPDLLKDVNNGIGGITQISYMPSSSYADNQLPFALPVISQIIRNDGNEQISTTNYDYAGGYYHHTEKDLRGFAYVKETGQAGADGEQKIVETWYHQGAGVTPEADDPSVEIGVTKSRPYLEAVSTGDGTLLRQTETTYASSDSAYLPSFFSPPEQIVESWCVGVGSCQVHAKTVLDYDDYGNIIRKEEHGATDNSDDNRTITTAYAYNTSDWLVGFPYQESIYSGIGTSSLVARTTYDYDNSTSSCSSSGTNHTPIKGNVTRTTRYLDGTNDPQEWFGYDSYGNQLCSRDAKGNLSTISYDSTATYARIVTNAKGQKLVNRYYGVDSEAVDNGLYGQLKSMIDPNTAQKTFSYDVFGRKVRETLSDGSHADWSYLNFGTVGAQHARLENSLGLWYELYFDGQGKIIQTKQPGPDYGSDPDNVIVNTKIYDARGLLKQESLPYFDGDTAYYHTNHYDALGRVIKVNKADGSVEQACYGADGSQINIDANYHKKRQLFDAYSNLTQVNEYKGTFTSCTTAVGTSYATTNYSYDSLNNLTQVENATGNMTQISYDKLGRKTAMDDPDMGIWHYGYDALGNLTYQQDAKGQIILFQYDSLNRLTRKAYATGTMAFSSDADSTAVDHQFGYLSGSSLYLPSLASGTGGLSISDEVLFSYDDASRNNAIGRMTRMSDSSGTTDYYYDDPLARTTRTIRTIDGTSYTIKTDVDAMLRTQAITYPDNQSLVYIYDDAGNLESAGSYATFGNYNALGKAGTVTYGNKTVASYDYVAENGRMAASGLSLNSSNYFSRQYSYFANGNIKAIVDGDTTKSQKFTYDELDRLKTATSNIYGALTYDYDKLGNLTHKEGIDFFTDTSAKPHQLVSSSNGRFYDYDANGNMLSDGLRSISYDAENRPVSISYNGGVTEFAYDGNGQRVKKSGPNGDTLYIDKLYEVNGSSKVKYIFAGQKRVAMVGEKATFYYHQDHLGGTSVVTNEAGVKVEQIYYKPFGETVSDTGSVSVNHKYTGQELDAETGLYNYNARLYNPVIGRFISADTLVPHEDNPQSFNRYAYCDNNPVLKNDPSGHIAFSTAVVIGVVANIAINYALDFMASSYDLSWDGVCGFTKDYSLGTVALNGVLGGASVFGGAAISTVGRGGLSLVDKGFGLLERTALNAGLGLALDTLGNIDNPPDNAGATGAVAGAATGGVVADMLSSVSGKKGKGFSGLTFTLTAEIAPAVLGTFVDTEVTESLSTSQSLGKEQPQGQTPSQQEEYDIGDDL